MGMNGGGEHRRMGGGGYGRGGEGMYNEGQEQDLDGGSRYGGYAPDKIEFKNSIVLAVGK